MFPKINLFYFSVVAKEKRRVVSRSWSQDEQEAVFRHLSNFISQRKLPGKLECEMAKTKEKKALQNRTWQQIKHFIRNKITKEIRNVKFTIDG